MFVFQVQLGLAWLGRRGSSRGRESETHIYLGITATQEQNATISPALIPAQEETDPALRDGVRDAHSSLPVRLSIRI